MRSSAYLKVRVRVGLGLGLALGKARRELSTIAELSPPRVRVGVRVRVVAGDEGAVHHRGAQRTLGLGLGLGLRLRLRWP